MTPDQQKSILRWFQQPEHWRFADGAPDCARFADGVVRILTGESALSKAGLGWQNQRQALRLTRESGLGNLMAHAMTCLGAPDVPFSKAMPGDPCLIEAQTDIYGTDEALGVIWQDEAGAPAVAAPGFVNRQAGVAVILEGVMPRRCWSLREVPA